MATKENNHFAKNFSFLVWKTGIGYKRVGGIIGRGKTTISRFVHGIHEPNIEMLMKISDLFDIDIDALVRVDVEGQGYVTQKYLQQFEMRLKKYRSAKKV